MSSARFVGFAGIPFDVLAPSGKVGDWMYGRKIVSEHIPGSDLEFTQVLGSPHARLTLRVEFATRDAFRRAKALEGTWGELALLDAYVTMPPDQVYHHYDRHLAIYTSVLLVGITRAEIEIGEGKPVECDITFQTEVRP